MDSHAFGNSSSSEDGVVQAPITKKKMQPRIYWKAPIAKRKGFDVVDAEDLFHIMFNPYYESWKSKK